MSSFETVDQSLGAQIATATADVILNDTPETREHLLELREATQGILPEIAASGEKAAEDRRAMVYSTLVRFGSYHVVEVEKVSA